ncbi:Various polyols ABC transporter, permease component 2 [Paenibacillus pasadenensis]|uniref:Various polyols ABC transporter, permease component 2 n=1 Tax=Paenibacillus pasadenensis TaxID=217090 RepID=A0A2N5N8K1_9BACL|nr:Various polyols ABC transporter, permease component 2 [Paenibacillus pasadenensis]
MFLLKSRLIAFRHHPRTVSGGPNPGLRLSPLSCRDAGSEKARPFVESAFYESIISTTGCGYYHSGDLYGHFEQIFASIRARSDPHSPPHRAVTRNNRAAAWRVLVFRAATRTNRVTAYRVLFFRAVTRDNRVTACRALFFRAATRDNRVTAYRELVFRAVTRDNRVTAYRVLFFRAVTRDNRVTAYRALFFRAVTRDNRVTAYRALFFRAVTRDNRVTACRVLFFRAVTRDNRVTACRALFFRAVTRDNRVTAYRVLFFRAATRDNRVTACRVLFFRAATRDNRVTACRVLFFRDATRTAELLGFSAHLRPFGPPLTRITRFFRASPTVRPTTRPSCSVFPLISDRSALHLPELLGFSAHLRPFGPPLARVTRFFRASPTVRPSTCPSCSVFPRISDRSALHLPE